MKTLLHTFLLTIVTLIPAISYAGPGDSCHFHGSKPAAEATIVKCANQRKETLIKTNKLDKSWASIVQSSITYVDGKKGKEWKVAFNNPQVTDPTKSDLFMFFTPPGNFIAANFTGQ